jgi:tetratricopeptide (TPR) repeat protein
VWWMGGTDLLLVASAQPLQTEAETLAVRMGAAEVHRDLARVGIEDATALAGCRVMGTEGLAAWAGEAGTRQRPAPGLARRDALQALLRLDSAAQGALPNAGAADSSLAACRTARGDYFRSLAAFQDRKFREATGYLESAATSCPQNHIFALRLSELYVSYSRQLAAGARPQDALTTARRAVDVNPRSYRALYNLASLERGYDPSAALALMARAVELNPDYVPAYLLQAEVQLGLVDFDAAGAAVSRALSIEPFNTEAHHLRALCLTHQGRFDDARRDLASVLAADPGNADAWAAMAYTWLLQSNLDKGERYYRKVLKLDPSHPDGLNNLAAILAEKGQYGTAIKLWEKALELDPGNPDIKRNIEEARKKMDQS